MLRLGIHVEVDLAGHPLLVALGEQSGDEAQTGRGVGEDRGDAGTALDLAVDAFEAVGGAQPSALCVRQIEDRETLGQVFLGPLGELGRFGSPSIERLTQEALGLRLVGGVEDRADAQRHGFALIKARHVGLRVLLQMELAALPGHAGQGGPSGGLEAGMIVGDDQLDPLQAAPDQAVEEGTPVHLRLGQGHRHAEDVTAAVRGHADGYQHGAIEPLAGLAHPLVAGIEEQIGRLVERSLAPSGEAGIELLGGAADLGRGDRPGLDQDVTLGEGHPGHGGGGLLVEP